VDFSSLVDKGHSITNGTLKSAFKQSAEDAALSLHDFFPKMQLLTTGKRQVTPKSLNQRRYIEAIRGNDIVFGIGPGGQEDFPGPWQWQSPTCLKKAYPESCSPGLPWRPEKLGFLPGDIERRLIPYLRPLYDSLHMLWIAKKFQRYMEDGTIEIAPLAFMRGRHERCFHHSR